MPDDFDGLPPKAFYAASNLKTNPFRQNPLLETDPRAGIWVGYEDEQQTFMRLLNQCRADYIGNANLILLYGELGAGKTHALMYARHQILVEQRESFNAVAYHIGSLRNDDKITFAATFERDVVRKSAIIDDVAGFRQHLDELCVKYRTLHGSQKTKDAIIEEIIPSRELASLAKEIIHAENEEQIKQVLVPHPKPGEFGTVERFSALINLFVLVIELGEEEYQWKKAAYLLIDELNLLVDSSAKEQRMANEIIRNIYDHCPNCFGFVLAFTASVATVSLMFDEWVLDRVSRQINMQTLPQNEAKEFIAGILQHERVDPNEPDVFRPFDEGAIDAIVSQMSSITPRRIMKTMERIIEMTRTANFDPATGLIPSEFLDEHGITDEIAAIPL